MTYAAFDFKSINRKLNRQEQKAEFEAKEAKTVQSMYGWPYGVAVPYGPQVTDEQIEKLKKHIQSPLKSMAHPEWPYTGTPHEWPKFKI
jgi:hypothetical protein